jgi:hypothetical protein
MGFGVIWRIHPQTGRGQVLGVAEPHLAVIVPILIQPGLPQDLYHRQLPQARGSIGTIDGIQEVVAIDAALGSFSAVTIPTGQTLIETGRPIVEQKNNAADIERTVQTIEYAVKEAEKLKLLALTDEEVATRLHKLGEALPAQVKQEVLILDDPREYGLVISERSEMVRQSEPWRSTKRRIHESLGLGSFRPRR